MPEFFPQSLIEPRQEIESINFDDENKILNCIAIMTNKSIEEIAELKNKIKENGGSVRIFVHPFMMGDHTLQNGGMETDFFTPVNNMVDGIKDHMTRFDKLPVILFEESFKLTDDGAFYLKKDDLKNAFIVPTQSDTPELDDKLEQKLNEVFNFSVDYKENKDGYRSITQAQILLGGLGVRKILLGGMLLNDEPNRLSGCLTPLIRASKELDIKVILSKYLVGTNDFKK